MKKIISVLLVLVLSLGLVLGVQAQTLMEPGQANSMAISDGVLYLMGTEKIATYKEGAISEFSSAPEGRYILFDGDDGLWALDCNGGTVGTINDGAYVEKLALEYEGMKTATGVKTIVSVCANEGILYVLSMDQTIATTSMDLSRFDLSTGDVQTDSFMYGLEVTAYNDTALLSRQDIGLAQSGQSGIVFDEITSDGALGDMVVSDTDYQTGLAAQAPDGTVYLSGAGQLKRVADGAAVNIGSIGVVNGLGTGTSARVYGDEYVAISPEGVFASPLEGNEASTTITIQGLTMTDKDTKFMQQNSDIALDFSSVQITGVDQIRTDITSGDSSVDIYIVHQLMGLQTLFDKNYVAPIDSPALIADVATMYPVIQEGLMRDGKLYGYPANFALNTWGLNKYGWNEVFGDMPVPTTYSGFFDMIALWNDEYADQYPDYQFTQLYAGGQQLVSNVLEQYALMHSSADKALSFDNPDFIGALGGIESLNLEPFDNSAALSQELVDSILATINRTSMIDLFNYSGLSTNMNIEDIDKRTMIAPMVFNEGEEPAVRADMYAYVINPNTKNMDAALAYLEFCAENMGGILNASVHPEANEPVRNDNFEKTIAEYEKEIEEQESRLEAAEDTEKTDIQNKLDKLHIELEDYVANDWLVNAENLAIFRDIAQYMTLGTNANVIYNTTDQGTGTEELGTILMRYIEGQLTKEQTAKELDKKLQMIYMEGN